MLEDIDGSFVLAKLRHDVAPNDLVSELIEELACDRNALGDARRSPPHGGHAIADVLRDAHARDLVVEELSVARRDQGAQAEKHRHGLRELGQVVEELAHDVSVVDRLSHDHLSACVDLLPQPPHLTLVVDRTRLGTSGAEEFALASELLPCRVQTHVEAVDDLEEPDRVEVKHSSGLRVVSHLGRVSSDDNHVVQSPRVVPQEIRHKPQEVPVPAAHVQDRLRADLPLHRLSERRVAHAHSRTRPVSNVDDIHSCVPEHSSYPHGLLSRETRGGVHLHAHDKVLGPLRCLALGAACKALSPDAVNLGREGRAVRQGDGRHRHADRSRHLLGRCLGHGVSRGGGGDVLTPPEHARS
mmetsp:Transcript_15663/g.38123  ORF Transcript_15663/g.38123 Transcript_15663/m.38123 type:complete len:356 (+) Transcript_15663:333-1400(+)